MIKVPTGLLVGIAESDEGDARARHSHISYRVRD
jgi:hypothetical protein